MPLIMIVGPCLSGCDKISAKVAALRSRSAPAVVDAGPPPPPPVIDAGPPVPVDDGTKKVQVTLERGRPLEKLLDDKVGRETAPALALVMTRLQLWWMDLKEAQPGDVITAVYELPPNHEPVIRALRYQSTKYNKAFAAYYFQAPGTPFGRYYQADGQELEERLKDSPIANYEQVTSFLKDGRRHQGVDFKCPVGTPVVMPFDGELVKKNWNWHGNGNCLEFVDAQSGRHAKFLHLSELPNSLQPGQHFKKGQQVAVSGNTGHTTAPHLHYQLESPSKQVLDPFKIHETYRARLDAQALTDFQKEQVRLDQQLSLASQ
jgi:murein DD-endopeptidase MepM/ murein hydrolase activator NlpD